MRESKAWAPEGTGGKTENVWRNIKEEAFTDVVTNYFCLLSRKIKKLAYFGRIISRCEGHAKIYLEAECCCCVVLS